uniref:Uncharacterized protein n=1 Tax=Avena sativa TaxID=4498 RepID=A0ACD5ZQS7_AVESA
MICSMFGPQGWADLPNELLHSIIVLLESNRDLLAFTATCPSWCAAFKSIRSTLGTLFPPLILWNCADEQGNSDSTIQHTWELIDLAYPSSPLRRRSPPTIFDRMTLVDCSHGHAIFSFGRSHVILDVFTGITILAPICPLVQLAHRSFIAPHSLSDSYLFVTGPQGLFAWKVGSLSWLHCDDINAHNIKQIVAFKGQVFARTCQNMYIVHLAPRLHLEALKVVSGDNMASSTHCGAMVSCDDMLMLLTTNLEAFSLDFSVDPPKYVKVADEFLEKRAFFIDKKGFCQPRQTIKAERMGLKGSQIYTLAKMARVYSYPVVDRPDLWISTEPCISRLNNHLLRSHLGLATWI